MPGGEKGGEKGERWSLVSGVEQLVTAVDGVEGLHDDIAGHDPALTALAGDTQGLAHLAQGVGPVFDGGADLGIGNTFTNTDVHGATIQ